VAFPWIVVLGPITRPGLFPGVLMESPSSVLHGGLMYVRWFVSLCHAAVTRDVGVRLLVRTTCTCRLGDDLFIIPHS
jgi:hypothetical protein